MVVVDLLLLDGDGEDGEDEDDSRMDMYVGWWW